MNKRLQHYGRQEDGQPDGSRREAPFEFGPCHLPSAICRSCRGLVVRSARSGALLLAKTASADLIPNPLRLFALCKWRPTSGQPLTCPKSCLGRVMTWDRSKRLTRKHFRAYGGRRAKRRKALVTQDRSIHCHQFYVRGRRAKRRKALVTAPDKFAPSKFAPYVAGGQNAERHW